MTCVRNEWGEDAYKTVHCAQDGCLADDRSIESYRKSMPIVSCSAMLDCIGK